MISAASPVAASIAGDLIVYFVCPLLVAVTLIAGGQVAKLSRRLTAFEQGLALVLREIMPPGERPSLRELIDQVSRGLGLSNQAFDAHLTQADERWADTKKRFDDLENPEKRK